MLEALMRPIEDDPIAAVHGALAAG